MMAGGFFLGPESTCEACENPPPPPPPPHHHGACCFEDGTCEIRSPRGCMHAGGEFQGPGSTCADCAASAFEGLSSVLVKAVGLVR
jgi:hypothetical protein